MPSSARLPIFDDVERVDDRPSWHRESLFDFLNRRAGEDWARVRELIQTWADELPDDEDYRDLRGRLRQAGHHHRAAYLELYLHALFLRAGFDVEIHPDIAGSRHPDFLVRRGEVAFYVEATTPGPSRETQAVQRRRADFLDSVAEAQNRDFFLSLRTLVVGPKPGAGKKARADVDKWLAGLDPDIPLRPGQVDGVPSLTWEHDGWEMSVEALPVGPEWRGSPDHRLFGIYADEPVHIVDDAAELCRALDKKSGAYGRLPYPLVVVLGASTWDPHRWEIDAALYGRLQYVWNENTRGDSEWFRDRTGDGFFGRPGRWRHADVDGVLYVHNLHCYGPQLADLTFYPHPGGAGDFRLLGTLLPVRTVVPDTEPAGRFQELTATAAQADALELFGIDRQWPGFE